MIRAAGIARRARCTAYFFFVLLPTCEKEPASPPEPAPDALPAASHPPLGGVGLTLPEIKAPLRPTELFGVGDTAERPDYTMRVKQLIDCKVESYFEPKAGNFTLGVEVELEGRTERQVPVNPFHAVLFDEAGNEYRPTLAGCKPGLRSQRISKDEKASGVIAFELPTAARGLSLSYTPFIVGSAKQEVAFQLGR